MSLIALEHKQGQCIKENVEGCVLKQIGIKNKKGFTIKYLMILQINMATMCGSHGFHTPNGSPCGSAVTLYLFFPQEEKKNPSLSINNWLTRDILISSCICTTIWMRSAVKKRASVHSQTHGQHTLIAPQRGKDLLLFLSDFIKPSVFSRIIPLCGIGVIYCAVQTVWLFSLAISPQTPYYVKVARLWQLMAPLSQ